VATWYQETNEELMQVTLKKWQKEHEAKLFQMKNTELQSHNDIIENQKLLLADQARKLEELNGTKDKLLSVVSHDLRAPVGHLRSILSMLSNKLITPDEFHGLSENLKHDVEGVHEMLEDVLNWVKSQHEGIVPHPLNFDIKVLADDVVQLAAPLASAKNIAINVDCNTHPIVYADRDQVHIIFRNLISNAIKFANSNTRITIRIISNASATEIKISDEGIGIREEDVKKIMTGMKVTGTSGTSGEKGTGLGLLLCREFIQLNGGTFFLESTVGKGTTVSFTFPGEPKA
jgi:signal transduction histidine kinase